MTKRQIIQSLKKIEECKKRGYLIEALFQNYHLNVSLLKFMLRKFAPQVPQSQLKVKAIVTQLIEEVAAQYPSRTIINKKNLKTIKPWLGKVNAFVKSLKQKQPTHTKSLLIEGEQIFMILNISISKMHARVLRK